MVLNIHFKVKFRWMWDWGKVEQTIKWKTPFNLPIPIPPFRDTIYNDRGVFLEIYNG